MDEVEIIDRDEPSRISQLKEWAYMWGYNDLLSGEIIVINTTVTNNQKGWMA